MPDFILTIRIHDFWHCGTGGRGSGDVDAEPVAEPCGLPYVPGKHLKGLLREAARFAAENGFEAIPENLETDWFGTRTEEYDGETASRFLKSGNIVVRNAVMTDSFADAWRSCGKPGPEISGMFETIRQTALKNGVALDKTLRSMRVAVPATLEARITVPEATSGAPDPAESLAVLCSLVRAVGHARNDGLGRCTVSCRPAPEETGESTAASAPEKLVSSGSTLLEIELTENVILSTSTATAGGHESLDHIPGSALWGIAASAVFPALKSDAQRLHALLFSEKLRFTNAYPLHPEAGDVSSGHPVPAPLSWHRPKDGEKIHRDLSAQSAEEAMPGEQPVQLRSGYIAPGPAGEPAHIHPSLGHHLKTAIAPSTGNAAEGQLFGFSYIPAGWRFLARIEWDSELADSEPDILRQILGIFSGREIRIGRSRSAEFGGARATLHPAPPAKSPEASSRSAFLLSDLVLPAGAGNGDLATLLPELLGNPDAGLVPEKCFIRTRRFSPWNQYRRCPDPERLVVSKGSVVTFKDAPAARPTRIGAFQAEGFGRISWSVPEPPGNPLATVAEPHGNSAPETTSGEPAGFHAWLKQRTGRKSFDAQAQKEGRRLSGKWAAFRAPLTPSQWSRLRNLASRAADWKDLKDKLVQKGDGKGRDEDRGIFTHGRMADKWHHEKGRNIYLDETILADLENLASRESDALALAACREAARLLAREAKNND